MGILVFICQVLVFFLPTIIIVSLVVQRNLRSGQESPKGNPVLRGSNNPEDIRFRFFILNQIKLIVFGLSLGLSIDLLFRLLADEVDYDIAFVELYHTLGLGIFFALLIGYIVSRKKGFEE
jgi:membrane-anchored glycerophosphoryl diester phosphodiesterase (GDPDase)